MSKFDEITSLLELLEGDTYGEWFVDKEHKGTIDDPFQMPYLIYTETVQKFITAVYDFCDANPDYKLTNYKDILQERGVEWTMASLRRANVENMDSQGVMALLMGLIRGERFCGGSILEALKEGMVQKWLNRLKEFPG